MLNMNILHCFALKKNYLECDKCFITRKKLDCSNDSTMIFSLKTVCVCFKAILRYMARMFFLLMQKYHNLENIHGFALNS